MIVKLSKDNRWYPVKLPVRQIQDAFFVCFFTLIFFFLCMFLVFKMILTLNFPWKMTSLKKCCLDPETEGCWTSAFGSSVIVQAEQRHKPSRKGVSDQIVYVVLVGSLCVKSPVTGRCMNKACAASDFSLFRSFSELVSLQLSVWLCFHLECGVTVVSLQPCYLRHRLSAKI